MATAPDVVTATRGVNAARPVGLFARRGALQWAPPSVLVADDVLAAPGPAAVVGEHVGDLGNAHADAEGEGVGVVEPAGALVDEDLVAEGRFVRAGRGDRERAAPRLPEVTGLGEERGPAEVTVRGDAEVVPDRIGRSGAPRVSG